MADELQPDGPDAGDPAEVFGEIPVVPSGGSVRSHRRWTRAVSAAVGLIAVGAAAGYLSTPAGRVDPNAPRVAVEVIGMHCPVQCGLRVSSSLEKLPFVLPGSVTANPKTGVVTFAATSAEAADEDQIRRAVEKAGFGFRSVTLPLAPPGPGG